MITETEPRSPASQRLAERLHAAFIEGLRGGHLPDTDALAEHLLAEVQSAFATFVSMLLHPGATNDVQLLEHQRRITLERLALIEARLAILRGELPSNDEVLH